MKILLLYLAIIGFVIANDNKTINQDSNNTNISNTNNINMATDNNATASQNVNKAVKNVDNNASSPKANQVQVSNAAEEPALSADEKLKNEIITFDRVDYIKNNTNIEDPFIYVYPQSEEDLASILKTEQAVLTLNGIFEDKASINNTWVSKNDIVEGWTVSDIKQDRVELKFRTNTKVLYVYSNDNKVKIK
ncbi:hypothetical protein CCY99_07840 [Helicobacter sp. 16-1353]|uniref:hypothetical protein n=1 Tax=Helicobacter sp. 16-1353 TaxID=2004996 RepID=UPI000DCE36FF|nr:hypothetical protein [Helicobacter sp. 16-1353]RAX52053.1 hypothetical protein CCY99_07840 [Helicobacter sp. 16-1353]